MTSEPLEKPVTLLNPLYLQAVRAEFGDSAELPTEDAETAEDDGVSLTHPSAITANEEPANLAAEGFALPAAFDEPAPPPVWETADSEEEPASPAFAPAPAETDALTAARDALSAKRAQIQQVRQQFDRLNRIKATVAPHQPADTPGDINQLKMKRLAIQMALVADSTEYTEADLQAVDKQIAECSQTKESKTRLPATQANSTELKKLNGKIAELKNRQQVLEEEVRGIILLYHQNLVTGKAQEYLNLLQAANKLRHELLAMTEWLMDDAELNNLSLGGELPVPSGLEAFDNFPPDALATSIEGIEEAKDRLSPLMLA